MINLRDDDEEIEEPSEDEDAVASLDDDLLDEVTDTDVAEEEEGVEGFGHINDSEDDDEDEEEDAEDDNDADATLEDDAEDVDYDTFDDIDEM